MRASTKSLIGAASALTAAGASVAAWFGFTVDDAWITARVAHHLATGRGARFNPGGEVVDAVTPLGFAHLLAPFAGPGPAAAFDAARALGLAAWLVAAAWLGRELARAGRRGVTAGAVALAATVPLGAWASSGMETGLVTALATFALAPFPLGPLAAGLAAGLRPELGPWALALSVGALVLEPGFALSKHGPRAAASAALALAPLLAAATLRLAWFGHAYPLAAIAKPSDLAHGVRYALGALALGGPPLLLLAPRALRRASARARAIAVALVVHAVAVALAGGDWMPLYRLFVPVFPSLVLAGAELGRGASSALPLALRVAALVLVNALVASGLGRAARATDAQRRALIERAAPLLAGAERVAALDVGWVGAATPADIVDLAGVTDPSIARLPGGHTTKRLPEGLLELRRVDALVVLARAPRLDALPNLEFVRGVEASIPSLAGVDRFQPSGLVPLDGTDQAYVILRRSPGDAEPRR